MGTWIKYMMAVCMYRSGLLWRWWARRRRPLVLMYHRVLSPDEGTDVSQPGIVVSTDTFDRQLGFLKRHFDVQPLPTVVDAVGEAGANGRSIAITFDDGWEDNHRLALPLLRRHDVPATIFVATGFIGTSKLFWPEQLVHMLAEPAAIDPSQLDGVPRGIVESVLAVDAADGGDARVEALDRLIEQCKALDESTRRTVVDALLAATRRDPAALGPRMLDWARVRELRDAGIEIGSHTVSHAILTRVDADAARRELEDSRAQVAAELDEAPSSFAYPNGDWSPSLAEQVRAAGYARAVVTETPPTAPEVAAAHPFAVVRKNVSEGTSRGAFGFSESVFACEIFGFFDAMRR